jgi:hypothetical protein
MKYDAYIFGTDGLLGKGAVRWRAATEYDELPVEPSDSVAADDGGEVGESRAAAEVAPRRLRLVYVLQGGGHDLDDKLIRCRLGVREFLVSGC